MTQGRRAAFLASVQPVKCHCAAGHDAVLGGRGDAGGVQLFFDHIGCAGEETVAMRLVGGPQDLVGADVIGEVREAALDRLERNPALAAEDVGRPVL